MIFTVDMGDLFGHWVPKRWISEVLKACGKYSQHTFQILTKFPHLAFEYMFPNNVWLGTTVTNVDDLIRINSLINSTASVKFVSIEPLHEDIFPKDDFLLSTLRFIDWIIVGAETGPGREKHFPETQWIHNIIRAAREYQIPLFIKDNLLFLDDESTGIEKIQEFPVIANNEADALLKEVV